MNKDSYYLDRALKLAAGGRGKTAPNPMVGAVLVKNGLILSEAYHRLHGGLHAEAEALQAAGPFARGADLYCNLEPCSYRSPEKHQGPCTEKIIAADIRHVHIGQLDPNPKIRGRGLRALEAAGIRVSVADYQEPFWYFNDAFNTWMALSRPFVHLKCAMSLDGRIAAAGGDSRWISDQAARREAHRFRAERDAVAVGIGTVLADNPELTTRLVDGKSPRPLVFDSSLKIPPASRLVCERGGELLVLTVPPKKFPETFAEAKKSLEAQGVTVAVTAADPSGRVDLAAALKVLAGLGIHSLFVEGGSGLLTSFLKSGLYDRFSAFIAPIILGTGVDAAGDLGIPLVNQALSFEGVRWVRIGDQQLFDAYRYGWLEELKSKIQLQEDEYVYRTC